MNRRTPLRLLNLGCGNTFHADWVNIDFSSSSPDVTAYDLRLGIPFADESFDVIYHSHLLEHFELPWAKHLLRECFRTLKPGGLLRVAALDLEGIARAYLVALDGARGGDEAARQRHEWMLIELLDQLVRTRSGGEVLRHLVQNPLPQKEFILSRLGREARNILENLRRKPLRPEKPRPLLPQGDADFAQSGERHHWMYDELSLSAMLEEAGFERITRQRHDGSLHPEIMRYRLDAEEDGTPRKPDSLFMEALKPAPPGARPLRVALLCCRDHEGAGTSALRLHRALRDLDVSGKEKIISQFYCASQKNVTAGAHLMPVAGQTPRRSPPDSAKVELSGLARCREERDRTLTSYPGRPAGREHFSLPQICCDPTKTPLFEDTDVVNLHWISGMFDPALAPESLRGRPVVWTLHDMNPFTGGCHYSAGCRRFTERCGRCPELGSADPKDLSFRTWRARMGAYRALNLHIVCPSRWLADEAKQSGLLGRFPVHVIPNPHPMNLFRPLNREAVRRSLGFTPDDFVLLFAAQSLNNERKGGAYLLDALRLFAGRPAAAGARLLLLGANPPADFFRIGLRAEAAGHVDGPEGMAVLYNAADAVIVPSLEDNLPTLVCEALGCGAPVVTFAAGGIPEMVRHKETGWLAPVRDAAGLEAGMEYVYRFRKDGAQRLRCRAFALEHWEARARAREYAELFRRICQ
jgi:glycosyltransferase involved in cell wall biosynthesis/SAM-dependent methyltransferase